jgi:hypothetical protein
MNKIPPVQSSQRDGCMKSISHSLGGLARWLGAISVPKWEGDALI